MKPRLRFGVNEREFLLLFLWSISKLNMVSEVEKWNTYEAMVWTGRF
jgi:hypothetical protein